MFSVIWQILKLLPEIFRFGKMLFKFLKVTNKKVASEKRLKKVREGMEYAEKTKDTRVLESVFK